MARLAYLSFPEFSLTSLRKQKRCCFSVFTYLVSSKWRTYHNDRSSGRHDFIRRKRYLARWTHRPLWHNRDRLKNTEIKKQTGWHECQYVFIQCRNSSTTDWDFSSPSLRRKVDPGKKVTLFNLIASVYIRKKLTSWLEPRADNSARVCSDSATAFLSDGRQPDAAFLHRWVVVWLKLLGESSL